MICKNRIIFYTPSIGWVGLSPTNGMVTSRATDICGVSMSQTLFRKDSNYDDQMSGFNCFNLFFNLFKYIWADFLKPSTRHNQTGSDFSFKPSGWESLGVYPTNPAFFGIFGSLSPQQTQHFLESLGVYHPNKTHQFFGRILPTFSGTISGARPGSCAQCTSMACPRIPPCRRFL